MVKQYLEHAREILSSEISEYKHNQRTNTGHISLVGYHNRYDLREGFPLLTTKRVPFKSVAHELIWFLRGESNIKYLIDNKVPIWNDNAFEHNLEAMVKAGVFPEVFTKHSKDWFNARDEYVERIRDNDEFAERWGDLGPVYGSQWIHWPKFLPVTIEMDGKKREYYIKDPKGIDQIATTLDNMRKNPTAKRHVISAWNPNEVPDMALPPCHTLFHLLSNGEHLDLVLYQRSCDMFLGVPFNIASYSMFTQILAQQLGLEPRRFNHMFGDVHFYTGSGERSLWYRNHLDELKQGARESHDNGSYEWLLESLNEKLPPEEEGEEGLDHVTGIIEQLARTPKELPRVTIADKPYNELTIDDFKIEGYDPEPPIRRALAV